MISSIRRTPTNYFALAKICEDAGDYEKAEEVLPPGKEARPNDPQVYLQLAASTTARGSSSKTIEALKQRAAIEPNNPEAYYTIATYYWDKAYRDFRLKDREKKDYRRQGHRAGRQGAPAQARLHGGADLQEPPAPAAGQPREGPGQAAALIKEADKLRDKAHGDPEEGQGGHQVAAASPTG